VQEAHNAVFAAIISRWQTRQHTIFSHSDLAEDVGLRGVDGDLLVHLRELQARGLIERREPDMVMLTAYGMSQGLGFAD